MASGTEVKLFRHLNKSVTFSHLCDNANDQKVLLTAF